MNDNLFARALLIGKVAKNVLADKAYDTNDIRKFIKNHGEKIVIPSQGRRTTEIPYNKYLYKKRNFVERFFQRIKAWRRIATRYEKTSIMYANMVFISCILFWLVY